ncbi:MAG: hypothetical protein AAF684_06810 [Pseudomonadota bacterium]
MEKRLRPARVLVCALAGAVLIGCATVNSVLGLGGAEEPGAACPEFGRMGAVDRMTRFDGPIGDPAAVLFEAEIVDVAANCDVDDDEFEAAAGMRLRVRAGPAWTGGSFDLPVVIAHVSGEQDVLWRRTAFVTATPAEGSTRAEADFTVEYELRIGGREEIADDRIMFGLRPTRAELNFLRGR